MCAFMRPSALLVVIAFMSFVSIGCDGDGDGTEKEAQVLDTESETVLDTISDAAGASMRVRGLTGVELFYDDGVIDQRNSPWSERTGGQLAVAFTPASYPVTIEKVSFYVGANGIPTKAFRVRVYPGDRADGPREQDLLDTEVVAAADHANQWVVVDMTAHDIIITEGDFFVAMEWLTPPGNYGTRAQMLGADTTDPDRRSWWKHYPDSDWVRIEEISDDGDRDLMIRATVLEGNASDLQ